MRRRGAYPHLWLPRWHMHLSLASVEPPLRVLGLPAFLSRDAVEMSRAHLNYSAAKARRELGWTHSDAATVWDRQQRALLHARRGFRSRRHHQAVVGEHG